MDSIYELDTVDEIRRLQSSARRGLQAARNPRALSAPRLLRQFLESRLEELNSASCGCENHEMLLIGSQSFKLDHLCFVSTVCARCRYHFHVKSDFQSARKYSDDHRRHMLIPCCQKSASDLKKEQTGFNDTISYARFICGTDGCLFNIEISVMPRRIGQVEVNKFGDKNRMKHNLDLARVQDPERYSDLHDVHGLSVNGMLHKYLSDALRNTNDRPLRINKRNKKFLVAIGSDFNDFLNSIGFYEGEDAESDEPCWFISTLEEQQNPTRVQTLRARMEETISELEILNRGTTAPAWDDLLHAFQGDYPNTPMEFSSIALITEADVALLGCLSSYPPLYFSWAAISLAKLCPQDREKYLDAGLRCIRNRSDDASTEIVVYKSQFDESPSTDEKIQEAFNFFGASPSDNLPSAWFLEMYYEKRRLDHTDEAKATFQQHLKAIGRYFDEDLISEINPELAGETRETGLMSSSPKGSGRRMSVPSAERFLNIEPNYTPEIIRGFVDQLLQNEAIDRNKIIEAVDVISEFKRQQDKPEEAAELQQMTEFIKATGDMPMLISQSSSSPKTTAFTDAPPGLKNIGNTCYLNSLLQYFYNVKVIRDLVLDFDQFKLDLDEKTVAQRRTGGNGTSVNLEEAIVARQFVEMLQGLFRDLQSTTEMAAQPSQKLANTALSSARDILEQPQSQPPPLPARPSPVPPVPPKEDDGVPKDSVNVTVESVNDKLETASSRSSQTLVDDNGDTPMSYVKLDEPTDILAPPPEDIDMHVPQDLDEKFAQVSRRLEQSDRSGTSQQDVEEIIGNILEHFMRAIRPDGSMPEKPGLQADKITKTFFTTIVNYTVNTTKGYSDGNLTPHSDERPVNVEIVPERWITAYPEEANMASDGISNSTTGTSCTLVRALDRYFSYEAIDDGRRARYSSIKTLPPILHICIQRSTPRGKNKNPVLIPEDLFLDRYMESANGSRLWHARKRVWAIRQRIEELEALSRQDTQPTEPPAQDPDASWFKTNESGYEDFKNMDAESLATMASEAVDKTAEEVELQRMLLEDAGVLRKRKNSDLLESSIAKKIAYPTLEDNKSVSDRFGDILWYSSRPLVDMAIGELKALHEKEQNAFEDMQKKYTIHAVICHRGGTAAGHYWVWIRDFQRNVWFRYNDETVTEDTRGTTAVLNDLNQTGDPYYVAYVNDDMKHELVDVPQRCRPDVESTPTGGGDAEMVELIEGVEMDEMA
ncbi:cysteine proteinase [Hypoxylon sp. FL1150]|nr:cysteine proteinase [Hypoxylon sp. FL1150]